MGEEIEDVKTDKDAEVLLKLREIVRKKMREKDEIAKKKREVRKIRIEYKPPPPKDTAPKDHLDFILRTVYDHQTALFPELNEFVLSIDTVNHDLFCSLKKKMLSMRPRPKPKLGHPIKFGPKPAQKKDPFQAKLAIKTQHISQTVRGYCRKPDGAYYRA